MSMQHDAFRNLLCAYPSLIGSCLYAGRDSAPRGKPVIEHNEPIMWQLTKPQEWVLAVPGRRVNPFFALAEVVWMWTGKGGAEFITFYNKSMSQFLDAGIPYFHAAYGRRVRHAGYSEHPYRELPYLVRSNNRSEVGDSFEVDQLQHVIDKIQADPDTRQAAVCLWDVVKDNLVQSKDHPCNNMLYFTQRDGQLNLSITMRSNDVIWGVPYNMCQFSHLQALMAGTLNLEVGSYCVFVNNLHWYKSQYPETLEAVLGWAENTVVRQIKLGDISQSIFQNWDMRWTIAGLDAFMSKVWEPLDKEMRNMASLWIDADGSEADPYFATKHDDLSTLMDGHEVPWYWQQVFRVLLMWHCRKTGAKGTYNLLLSMLPKALRWMVQDFDKQEVK